MYFPMKTDEEFEQILMNILNLSTKDTTYKFAFARFLLDYSMEYVGKTHVEFTTIAEYFLKYYWIQECKSKLNQTYYENQHIEYPIKNTKKKFVVNSIIIEEFGERYYPQSYEKIKETESEKIIKCINKIKKRCFNDVTYAFQLIKKGNKTTNIAPILFEYKIKRLKISNTGKKPSPIIDLSYGINLNPDALSFFRRYNIVLQKAVTLEWTRFIENYNLGIPELIQKIEGNVIKRKSLAMERKTLTLFFKNCFYCNIKLKDGKETNVEHVIPFAYIGMNEIWNLVLACKICNNKKLGSLPSEKYFRFLIKRNSEYRKKIPQLEKSLSKLDIDFEKNLWDHYQNAKSHGYQIFDNFAN